MKNHIKIQRIPYEEPDCIQLNWSVSNGNTSTNFKFYVDPDSIKSAGEHLECFPRHASDVYLFEIGSDKAEDRWAYYFRFRVFTVNQLGKSAIQIRFSNNLDLPYRENIEMCIEAEAASINQLGRLLKNFSKLEDEFLFWESCD